MATKFLASLQGFGTNGGDDLTHQSVPGSDLVLRRRDLSSASVPTPKDRSSEKSPPARITLPRPAYPGEQLCLQVALIRDLRRLVPVVPHPEGAELPIGSRRKLLR